MKYLPKKKYIITSLLAGFFFVGVSFKHDFFEITKQIEIFTTMFKTVNMNYVYQTNPGELMDIAIKNMIRELDPNTDYYNVADVSKYRINSVEDYTRMGATVNGNTGKVTVAEVFKDYAADKARLRESYEITNVDDIKLEDFKEVT